VIGLFTQKQRYLIRHELPGLGTMRTVSAGFYLLMISFGAYIREPHTALGQMSHGNGRSPPCGSELTPRRVDCFKPVPRHTKIVSDATDKIERMSGRRLDTSKSSCAKAWTTSSPGCNVSLSSDRPRSAPSAYAACRVIRSLTT
jgi:hypothetical protein